jgi:hypothetical protein
MAAYTAAAVRSKPRIQVCVVVFMVSTVISGDLRASNRAIIVSVSAVASARAVLRCCNESFILMNNRSREKGSGPVADRTMCVVDTSNSSLVVHTALHAVQLRRLHV